MFRIIPLNISQSHKILFNPSKFGPSLSVPSHKVPFVLLYSVPSLFHLKIYLLLKMTYENYHKPHLFFTY